MMIPAPMWAGGATNPATLAIAAAVAVAVTAFVAAWKHETDLAEEEV